MGADWTKMIDVSGSFFAEISGLVAILVGIGIALWIMDWLLGMAGGDSADTRPTSGHIAIEGGRGSPRRHPRPRHRREKSVTINSWDELEAHARTYNNYKGS